MKITFDIPDTKAQEIIDAFCDSYKYQTKVIVDSVEVDNPQTKAQFTKAQIVGYIKNIHKSYLVNQAVNSARETEIVKPDVEIT